MAATCLLADMPVPLGSRLITADVWQSSDRGQVLVYFVRRDEFFDRSQLYGSEKGDYFDNGERFIFFCRTVPLLCRQLNFKPDIIHCHDWQTALVPAYLDLLYRRESFWRGTKSVFTIHNIGYQGIFAADLFTLTGLPKSFFSVAGMEFWGGVNFMKAGIVCADAITTVSPRYSEEICTSEYGNGLDGLLRQYKDKLHGILNGVDYREWNPETDPYIAAPYSVEDLSGKLICKEDLLDAFQLPPSLKHRPLLGMVSRLAEQKGFDLLTDIIDNLMEQDLGMVLLGSGELKYERFFSELAQGYPEKIGVRFGYDNRLAHKIEAGADMFLMPSRYEPCGLNQIYSLRYGTVPIVRATGGLFDTVEPYDPRQNSGVGFTFEKYEPEALLGAVLQALRCYARPEVWKQIMKNAMKMDFSWGTSAQKYLELYQQLLQR